MSNYFGLWKVTDFFEYTWKLRKVRGICIRLYKPAYDNH